MNSSYCVCVYKGGRPHFFSYRLLGDSIFSSDAEDAAIFHVAEEAELIRDSVKGEYPNAFVFGLHLNAELSGVPAAEKP